MCFVCNKEMFYFEKAGIDFEKHRKYEHNLWHYIYLIISMQDKTAKECNGVEHELFDKIAAGDHSWIPVRRSMSLGKIESLRKVLK